jgi:hypothetical protein
MNAVFRLLPSLALLLSPAPPALAAPPQVSGIYPHLAMFNDEGECGTGAVVPWAGRLWVVTYAPHQPKGSSDKLYEISPDLLQTIRPESVGGTPANRMIHEESQQLFIGPHVIDAQGAVRTIPYSTLFGRPTGMARHLTDPGRKVVFATMEEGIYEVDVRSLEVKELWADEQKQDGRHAALPGYHGKGFHSTQGRYVYANNGDHAKEALRDPSVPSGVLAEWDGRADQWTVVRRNQFTDVTGPGGLRGSLPSDPAWAIGWDHRSLILMLLDGGKWQAFRLPKSSHSYDGAHGWNTEWPRIRDIGEDSLLMSMHGCFWRFPRTFSAAHTAGIAPRSNYLKVVGDFCRWNEHIVLGCDDAAKSEFLNKHPLKGALVGPGQSQSNLQFLAPAQLDAFGPVLGRGAVWMKEDVAAHTTSDPYLLSGFHHKSLQINHSASSHLAAPTVVVEVDAQGTGTWTERQTITLTTPSQWIDLTAENGVWIRLKTQSAMAGVTAMFHSRAEDRRPNSASALFAGLGTGKTLPGVLLARGGGFKTLRFVGAAGGYDLDAELKLKPSRDDAGVAWTAKQAAIPASRLEADAASLFYTDANGTRWRMPLGTSTPEARVCREVCTERNLLNAGGTFFEMPAENAGGLPKIRPVATHLLAISDYTSYRGLLVMSGVREDAHGEHIIRSDDGKAALWVGAVDDLWQLGKPRGQGGPWRNSAVKAGQPSDPYLATGYDKKRLTLSHQAEKAVTFLLEADFTGTGSWHAVIRLTVDSGKPLEHEFPAAFGAYWLRLTADTDTVASAHFVWE